MNRRVFRMSILAAIVLLASAALSFVLTGSLNSGVFTYGIVAVAGCGLVIQSIQKSRSNRLKLQFARSAAYKNFRRAR